MGKSLDNGVTVQIIMKVDTGHKTYEDGDTDQKHRLNEDRTQTWSDNGDAYRTTTEDTDLRPRSSSDLILEDVDRIRTWHRSDLWGSMRQWRVFRSDDWECGPDECNGLLQRLYSRLNSFISLWVSSQWQNCSCNLIPLTVNFLSLITCGVV